MKICYRSVIIGAAVGIITITGIVYLGIEFGYYRKFALSMKISCQEHVYVNMNEVTEEVVKKAKYITDKERAKIVIAKYKKEFDKEFSKYIKESNAMIFSSPKPIAGAKDKTKYFIVNVNKKFSAAEEDLEDIILDKMKAEDKISDYNEGKDKEYLAEEVNRGYE